MSIRLEIPTFPGETAPVRRAQDSAALMQDAAGVLPVQRLVGDGIHQALETVDEPYHVVSQPIGAV